jgi:hypothetical protein
MNINNGSATSIVLWEAQSSTDKLSIWDFELTVAGSGTVVTLVSGAPTLSGSAASNKVLATYTFAADGGIVSPPGKHYKGITNPGESLLLLSTNAVSVTGRMTALNEIPGLVV